MITVSANRRFLQRESGDGAQPFFWLGDTAWELFHRLTREEASLYLDRRAAQGFNVIQAVAIAEFGGDVEPNRYGDVAALGRDPARPNEKYFEHVDFVVRECNRVGMAMGLLPTWGSWVKKSVHRPNDEAMFNEDSARAYGRFLGGRYKDADLVWILGGDRDGAGVVPVWRAMAAGIRAGGARQIMTWHPAGEQHSSTFVHDEEWLALNMIQSGHGRKFMANYAMIEADYARTPTKPVLDGEAAYEMHPVCWNPDNGFFTDHDVRASAYWSVFSGACGHTYGCQNMWQFANEKLLPLVNARPVHWTECLDLPGAQDMRHLKALMLSRPYFSRVPDRSIGDHGQASDHVAATRDGTTGKKDATFIMVYRPFNKRNTVDVSAIAGKRLIVWMFDPREGTAQRIGEFANEGKVKMPVPPGGPDWVLVVDDADAGYPAPGEKPS
jgi:hypothetical protein